MKNEDENIKAGRPAQAGKQRMIAIRTMSQEDYDIILKVPTTLRAKILLEWSKENMAHMIGCSKK